MASLQPSRGTAPSGRNSALGGTLPSGIDNEVIAQIVREEYGKKGVTDDTAKEKVIDGLGLKGKMIVFYGFQGVLANKFSLVDEAEQQEVKLRCLALSDSISPAFQDVVSFFDFHNKYDTPKGTMQGIKFEDAISELRMGEKFSPKKHEFIDAEVDEFDDNCTEECIPGDHKCGK